MPTYKTSKPCFIGDKLRGEGETFTVAKAVKPLPEWLEKVELTAAQKQEESDDEQEVEHQLEIAEDNIEILGGNPDTESPDAEQDFMEPELSSQQRSANTRKRNAEAAEAEDGELQTL